MNIRYPGPANRHRNPDPAAEVATALPQHQTVRDLQIRLIDVKERGLLRTKFAPVLNALAVWASLSLRVNITAVRFEGERRTLSRIALASPPIWKSMITASNFRWFTRINAVVTSSHTFGSMSNYRIDSMSCSIVVASLETSRATSQCWARRLPYV